MFFPPFHPPRQFTATVITIILPFLENYSVSSLSDLKLQHKRQMKDANDEYDIEKSRIDHRDAANAQEIDTLRRKCICLTKL
jgi:hypothetical protein